MKSVTFITVDTNRRNLDRSLATLKVQLGSEITMDEVDEASTDIKNKARDAEVFWGLVYDDSLELPS